MDKYLNKNKRQCDNDANMDDNKTKKRRRVKDGDDKDCNAPKVARHGKTVTGAEPVPTSSDTSTSHAESGKSNDIARKWTAIRDENLVCNYSILYSEPEADQILRQCEEILTYNEGMLAKIKVFGQWHDIPRQQVAYGDTGLSYSFSNTTVPARPWIPLLERLRDRISMVTGYTFNFVLINRYRNGNDHIGEHRDDELDLSPGHPIASLSLGQTRDFIFKHADARGKTPKRKKATVKVELDQGSLLIMKHPTNTYWYHSLPPRKKAGGVRINMTFRKMVNK